MSNDASLRIDIEHAMQAAIEAVAFTQLLVRDLSHPRHDAHAEHDINRIGQFDSYFGKARSRRAHQVRDDVHCTAAHRLSRIAVQLSIHLVRSGPIVCWTNLFFQVCADVRILFNPGDIVRI